MKFIIHGICKLGVSYEIRNVRSKFTRAAVLKAINEPLVFEDFKISDKLKEGQVTIIFILKFFICKIKYISAQNCC